MVCAERPFFCSWCVNGWSHWCEAVIYSFLESLSRKEITVLGSYFEVIHKCMEDGCGKVDTLTLLDEVIETYCTFRSAGNDVFCEKCFNFQAFLYELSEHFVWNDEDVTPDRSTRSCIARRKTCSKECMPTTNVRCHDILGKHLMSATLSEPCSPTFQRSTIRHLTVWIEMTLR